MVDVQINKKTFFILSYPGENHYSNTIANFLVEDYSWTAQSIWMWGN